MRRFLFALLFSLLIAPGARAHFVFVVPAKDSRSATVVMSESLEADARVPITTIAGTRLAMACAGTERPLKLVEADHAFTVELPPAADGVIYGISELGVIKRGGSKPALLSYYPKAIIGDPFTATTVPGDRAPMELKPIRSAGKTKLQFLFGGKPVAKSEVTLILPDGADQTVTTDDDGNTPALEQAGRYGAWARHVEPVAGDRDGKHYDETREYTTLVFDLTSGLKPATIPASTVPENTAASFATLTQPVASFGAVVCDGWLYVYGGHTGVRHDYSTVTVTGSFHRLNLSDPRQWQPLTGGPAVQGMNLAAYGGKIYRAGGMMPRNAPGQPQDNISIPDVARFDPVTQKWESLPPLPTGRSSHDVAIVNGKLYVIGGWQLGGGDAEATWLDQMAVLDLRSPGAQWEQIPQPFSRRALTVAAIGNRIYAIGGFDSQDKAHLEIDVYDTADGKWSKAPSIPGKQAMNGFAPAACVMNNRLYLSIATGELFRLDSSGQAWKTIAKALPRIVHRIVPFDRGILIIGGAAKSQMVDLIELITPSSVSDKP